MAPDVEPLRREYYKGTGGGVDSQFPIAPAISIIELLPRHSEIVMSTTCKECGARCCRYFCFEIDKPTSYDEFENLRWYLMHEGVTVHIDLDDDWYMAIANRCKNLDENNLCKQYDNRPLICRKYDTEGCDFTQGDYEYKVMFTTPEQVENYASMKMGKARFEKIKIAARARVEKERAKAKAKTNTPEAAPVPKKKKKPVRKSVPYIAKRQGSKTAKRKQPLNDLFAY